MKKNNDNRHPILSQEKLWSNNEHLIWLVSTISLARNVEKFNFPGKLETSRQKQLLSLIKSELPKIKALSKPEILKAEDVSPTEKEFLTEHFLSPQAFQQTHTGEGFIVDDSSLFLGTINIRDHLNLMLLDCEGELESTWNKLVSIETTLGDSLSYAYSQKFGFLTADPVNCGTGLKVSVFLQLSGLIHTNKIDDVLTKNSDDNIAITGIQGSPSEIIGDILVIQNNYSLGITEENIISNIRNCCTKLQAEEKSARKKIQDEGTPEVKDRVSRAYAILVYSYQIEAIEALNALSLLKLGIQFGWIKGIDMRRVNELFFNCRRAHLLTQHEDEISQEELSHKRAEFIHKNLKGVELTI